jgi:hypothetical protein
LLSVAFRQGDQDEDDSREQTEQHAIEKDKHAETQGWRYRAKLAWQRSCG